MSQPGQNACAMPPADWNGKAAGEQHLASSARAAQDLDNALGVHNPGTVRAQKSFPIQTQFKTGQGFA